MIVLDTHAWIWFISNPELLSTKAARAINSAIQKKNILISSISVWEIALLVKKNRLKLTMDIIDWLRGTEKLPFIQFIPVDNEIALKSVGLSDPFHNDPADRIIIATALTAGAPLVTKDDRILKYPHVKTVW